MKKLKGSIAVEAAISLPIAILVITALILAMRLYTLESLVHFSLNSAETLLEQNVQKLRYSGLMDMWLDVEPGEEADEENVTQIITLANGDYTYRNRQNELELDNGALSNIEWRDETSYSEMVAYFQDARSQLRSYKYDYEATRNVWELGGRKLTSNGVCQKDFEAAFQQMVEEEVRYTFETHCSTRFGKQVVSAEEMSFSGWDFSVDGDFMRVTFVCCYKVHNPLTSTKSMYTKTMEMEYLFRIT